MPFHLTTPVVYATDGDRLLVFASKAGAPTNPAWYHNLVANPTVTLEVGSETFAARATVLAGEERDGLFAEQARRNRGFAEYQAKTSRVIPVVALERIRWQGKARGRSSLLPHEQDVDEAPHTAISAYNRRATVHPAPPNRRWAGGARIYASPPLRR